eukprot:scaffold95678_cov85-Phaeocystis_antarctica.AAC.2
MPRALLFLESGHGVRRVCKRQQVCVGVDLAVDVVNQHCGWKGRFGRLDRCCRRFVDAVGVSDFDETELVANKTAASVACEVCGQRAALVECVTCRVLGCVMSAAVRLTPVCHEACSCPLASCRLGRRVGTAHRS